MNKALYSSFFILTLFLHVALVSSYSFSDFNKGTENVLEKKVNGGFAKANEIILKSEAPQSFEYLVIGYTLFIVFFSIILSLTNIFPLFQGKKIFSFIVAFCITGLAGISGSFDSVTKVVIGLTGKPEINSWSSIAFFIFIILFVAVATVANKLLVNIRRWEKREEARDSGFKLGSDVEITKMYSSLFKK